MKTFSIVIPVYQNELNLKHTVPELLEVASEIKSQLSISTRLIFVDDGSTDDSYNILMRFRDKYPNNISVLKLSRNFGQTPAIQAGISYSDSDCTGIISADLQDPPKMFIEMLSLWLKGDKYIIAERKDRKETRLHRFVSGLYWKMVANFSMEGFPKGGYDFCIIDNKLARLVSTTQEKNTSIFPLMFWFGLNPTILSYQRDIREHGKSTWTFLKKIKLTIDTVIGFTYLPTRIISLSAIFTSLLAFIYSFAVFFTWLLGDGSAPDGWTTIALLILIIGGVILFGLGIVCEYQLRILDEVRKRPNFVLEEVNCDREG